MSEEKKKAIKKEIKKEVAVKPKKKNRTVKQKVIRGLLIAFVVLVVLIFIAILTLYLYFKHYYDKTNYIKDEEVLATTMAAAEMSSVANQMKNDEILAPVESSIYDEISKTAEVTMAEDEGSSIAEEIKESIKDKEESSIYNEAYESIIDDMAEQLIADNPESDAEAIKQSLINDESIAQAVSSQASEIAESQIASKAEEEISAAESSAIDSKAETVRESISEAAHESASEIVSQMESQIESQSQAMESQEVAQSGSVYNVLIIGVDSNNYSDTLILLSINSKKNTIYMTSILRDTCVNYGSFGAFKLNNTYRFSGAVGLVQAIEENFKVKIDNYAFINFNNMAAVFDAIGGLDINIPQEEYEAVNAIAAGMVSQAGVTPNFSPMTSGGMQHLMGYQLMGYCRQRYIGAGDMQRTERQRTVLTALFNKLKSSGLGTVNDFLNTALPLISHNISSGKVMELLLNAGSYLNYSLVGLRVPYSGTYTMSTADDYWLIADLATNAQYLKETIY